MTAPYKHGVPVAAQFTGNAGGAPILIDDETGDLWCLREYGEVYKMPVGQPGPEGPAGPEGPQGVQGAEGVEGPQGASGAAGAPGAQGPKGDTGDTGNAGAQGIPGTPGANGAQGAQGQQGIQGIQGIQGVQGNAGPAGPNITTSAFGYGAGAGGTVTQLTSKATTVVLNKLSGKITTHNAALAAAAEVSFTVTNSTVAAADVVVVNHSTGGTGGAYEVQANTLAAGSFKITLGNVSAGSLSEAIGINFIIIKGAVA